jgi:hypothetical protein
MSDLPLMRKNPAIQRVIDWAGSRKELARRLKCTEVCITNALNGRRNWSFRIAAEASRLSGEPLENLRPDWKDQVRYLRGSK